jgi:hypothetical protein
VKEGYVAFVVSVRPRSHPQGDPLPLDNIDGKGTSLIDQVVQIGTQLVGRKIPETEPMHQAAHRFDKLDATMWGAGTLLIEGEAGSYGAAGSMVQVQTGTGRPFGVNEASMIPVRACLMTFTGERYGLLISERRGSRTFRYEIERSLLKPGARQGGVTIAIEAHIDPKAWAQFLKDADIASVKAVYRSTRREDYLPTVRTQPKLTLSAEGPLASRLGKSILRGVFDRVSGKAAPDAILLGDLIPRDADSYERERVTIKAENGGLKRTITVGADGVPQWVYETGKRLSLAAAQDSWLAQAEELIQPYRADGGHS